MIIKEINVGFEHSNISVEYNTNSNLITLRVAEYEINEEKCSTGHTVYQEKNVTEIYLDSTELKEVIKALQEVVIEDAEDE